MALGIATFWPVLFVPAMAVVGYAGYADPEVFLRTMHRVRAYGMSAAILTGALTWGLLIFYLRHLSTNQEIPAPRKPFWQAALILGIFITMPIYWYRFIWLQDG
jgi:hypothetical protein